MSVQIRFATADDAQRICEINESALDYHYPLKATQHQLIRVLARPTDRVWVACVPEDHVVGFLHASDYETLHAGSLKNIVSLAVEESSRGLGIGRLLTEAVEAWAREDGCEAVRLVSGQNRIKAHVFYAHCGYDMRKEQKNFIKYLKK